MSIRTLLTRHVPAGSASEIYNFRAWLRHVKLENLNTEYTSLLDLLEPIQKTNQIKDYSESCLSVVCLSVFILSIERLVWQTNTEPWYYAHLVISYINLDAGIDSAFTSRHIQVLKMAEKITDNTSWLEFLQANTCLGLESGLVFLKHFPNCLATTRKLITAQMHSRKIQTTRDSENYTNSLESDSYRKNLVEITEKKGGLTGSLIYEMLASHHTEKSEYKSWFYAIGIASQYIDDLLDIDLDERDSIMTIVRYDYIQTGNIDNYILQLLTLLDTLPEQFSPLVFCLCLAICYAIDKSPQLVTDSTRAILKPYTWLSQKDIDWQSFFK